ncbi:hypothetical protein K466DRAFT_536707 [Polyporus arcularius HHB13444]|uniref:Fe2OG dioxygenase domain-containing protein n=1 Tax=Polyporus arcularius HHB13444 TaxID=1314778 RepID=A0A5C3PWH3_9APHY|nr:hypothetical protein K466DRAFT_536707 [Polyporus arcularius HHB13444]
MPKTKVFKGNASHAQKERKRTLSEVQSQSPSQLPSSSSADPEARPTKRQHGLISEPTSETSAEGEESTSATTQNVTDAHSDSEDLTFPVSQEYPPVALKLVKAIQNARVIPSIGYCPTQMDRQAENMLDLGPEGLSKGDIETNLTLTEEEAAREQHNAAIIAKLSNLYTQHARNKASGYLDKPFRLRITRATCRFDEFISPATNLDRHKSPNSSAKDKKTLEDRLKRWYDNADVSGYGDVREQVTKVDETVRKAREIPATQFSVEPALLERIAGLWDQHFYPNRGIRVEPYKIHLYGPEGHFGAHRDTPQKDLIGTFLLGLGDTSRGGGLVVDGEHMPAHEGHWCAFYPDVPHRVEEVYSGHRAVIAFKIFRTSGTGSETETTARVRQETTELMDQMQAPFGIMLERKYCMGTTELSGFDALLLKAALTLPDADVRHLPVVLATYASYEDDNQEDYEMECDTHVVPLTRGHLDKWFDEERSASPSHTECGCPWLEGVQNVPFFSLELRRALYPCIEEQEETCNDAGNEAQAWREDSVYLSYALLALPKARSG